MKASSKVILEAEGDTHVDLFTDIASMQEVFSEEQCGCCNSSNIRFVARQNADEDWYDGQHHCINVSWDDNSESTNDVVTGYSDSLRVLLLKIQVERQITAAEALRGVLERAGHDPARNTRLYAPLQWPQIYRD